MRHALAALLLALLAASAAADALRWKPTTPTDNGLRAVAFRDAEVGMVAGHWLTLLRTTDGGVGWTTIADDLLGTWYDVRWTGPDALWAVGQNGIFQPLAGWSLDGGLTWQGRSFYIENNEGSLRSVAPSGGAVLASAVVWDGTGAVVRSADGGATWDVVLRTAEALVGLDAAGLAAVAVGIQGAAFASVDGGLTWTRGATGSGAVLSAVDLLPGGIAVAVGEGGAVLRSEDGGLAWAAMASATTQPLHGVQFATPSLGWAAGASGALVRTTDGGRTWAAEDAGTSLDLHDVAAAPDAQPFGRGWYVGDGGTVGMGWELPPAEGRRLTPG